MCLSSFRVCEIPGYTHAHARTETFEKRARVEGGGAARFRAELSEPEQGPVLEFQAGEALHRLLECSLSILTRVESSSILEEVATCSVLYHRRFFHVTPNLSCRDDF